MKKIFVFLAIVVVIVCIIAYQYNTYQRRQKSIISANNEFEQYLTKDIYGIDIATLINKAYDNNLTESVEKNEKGKFIENDTNSIKIDIKMLDTSKTYDMETLYSGGMDKFVQYYNQITFKCTKIDYHKSTGKVKYMLIEQITQ